MAPSFPDAFPSLLGMFRFRFSPNRRSSNLDAALLEYRRDALQAYARAAAAAAPVETAAFLRPRLDAGATGTTADACGVSLLGQLVLPSFDSVANGFEDPVEALDLPAKSSLPMAAGTDEGATRAAGAAAAAAAPMSGAQRLNFASPSPPRPAPASGTARRLAAVRLQKSWRGAVTRIALSRARRLWRSW